MNINKTSLFWGILLMGAGALALARQWGYISNASPLVWAGVFALISLLALLNYALGGWKQWGWLFPTGVFGGLAVTTALAAADVNNAAIASPLFFGLIIPFAAAYFMDRERNWWALIPGGVMTFLALTTLLVDRTARDEWVGSLFLFMVALSFLFVYLQRRTRIWALIVAYSVGVLGFAPLLASFGRNADYFGALFLFAIALPFFAVYFRSVANWWAIIPAGALTTLAIIAALSIAGIVPFPWENALMTALLMAGLAVTFAVLWLRHDKQWAKIVTIILAALVVASLFLVNYSEILWPVAIIVGGLYLFYTALRPRAS